METVQSTYFCFRARPANSKFATKTAKKRVNISKRLIFLFLKQKNPMENDGVTIRLELII